MFPGEGFSLCVQVRVGMIICRINQRLIQRRYKDHGRNEEPQSPREEEPSCSYAALGRSCPDLMLRRTCGAAARNGDHRSDWMMKFYDQSIQEPLRTENLEQWSLHAGILETSSSDHMYVASDFLKTRQEDASRTEFGDSPSRLLETEMASAIKSVVDDAVDSFSGDYNVRSESMDLIADDLLQELERAAAQVADMEAEVTLLNERVEQSESRSRTLEHELAKARGAESNCLASPSHCCSCTRIGSATERRLAFLEEICRRKDTTILELEQEINSLHCKISELLFAKEDQRSVAPVTIKELLVNIGSRSVETSEIDRRKSVGKKATRKTGSSNVLVDLTPNMPFDSFRTPPNPTKKLKL